MRVGTLRIDYADCTSSIHLQSYLNYYRNVVTRVYFVCIVHTLGQEGVTQDIQATMTNIMIIYFLTTCCILKGELLIVFEMFFFLFRSRSLFSFPFIHFSCHHFNISIQFPIAISFLLLIPDFECHINRSLIFIMAATAPFHMHYKCLCWMVQLANKTQTKTCKYFHIFS